MKQYLDELREILNNGIKKSDRTGVGTISIFGHSMKFDLSTGEFPLLTTKKVFIRGVIEELLWMINGDPDVKLLQAKNVHIWDEWEPSPDSGKFVPYPIMWRHYPESSNNVDVNGGIDQLQNAINLIKDDPGSRRIIVDSWNAALSDKMVLTPCHCMYQFYVREDYLDMQLLVRSNDVFLGQPFNIAQYSLLLMMVAQVTDKKPGILTYITGDTHIYLNHLDQVKTQLEREPRPLPKMLINPEIKNIDEFKYEDFKLEGYNPWPAIKAPVAV
jgi:thymidylate synthase